VAPLLLAHRAGAQPVDLAAMMAERSVGQANAPISVVEYFSLTCGHCASFHLQTLPRIKAELVVTGRLRLIYSDFPLDRVSLAAHMVARAMPVERYDPFIETLFRTQAQWAGARDPIGALAQVAGLAGMSRPRFDAVLADEPLQRAVLELRLKGEQQDRVEGTPTFVASTGRRATGAATFERFLELAGGPWPAAPAAAPTPAPAQAGREAGRLDAIPEADELRPLKED
jgi:protein-disulfide isomerase